MGSPRHTPSTDPVGRPEELTRIAQFVDDLGVAARSLVVVGEAGIGKTTLWTYGVDLALHSGARVLSTRPAEDDWPSPGLGLRDLLHDVDPTGGTVAGLLDTEIDPPERARRFLGILRELTDASRVVIAVDDLQWLDIMTTQLVRYALRRLQGVPVAVLATARTWSLRELELPLKHLTFDAELLTLTPLSVPGLREVLARRAAHVTHPDLLRLHKISGGNPFFAIELSRQWHRGERAAIRTTADALLIQNIKDLAPAARQLLNLIALGGPARLSALLGADGGSADALGLIGDPLAPFVECDETFIVRCAHPLIASAVRAVMDPETQRTLHSLLVERVDDPVARARHLASSVLDPDERIAAELEQAAALAVRRGSPATAAELAEQSVRLTPRANAGAASARALAEVTYRAIAGQIPDAISRADRLLEREAIGPVYAQLLRVRSMLDMKGAEAYLRRLLSDVTSAEDPNDELVSMLLEVLGWQLGTFKGRLPEATDVTRRSLEAARRVGHPHLISRAAATFATVSLLAGRPARDLMAEATSPVVDPSEDPYALLRVGPEIFATRHALWDGDLLTARAGFEDAYRRGVRAGSEFQRPYRLRDLALLEVACGRLEQARRISTEAIESANDAGNEQALAWLAYPFGLVSALFGEPDTTLWAVDRIDRWATLADEPLRRVTAHHLRGLLAGSRGEWSDALRHFLAGTRTMASLGYRHPGFIPVLPAAVDAATIVGDTEQCAALVQELESQAKGLGAPWVSAVATLAAGQYQLLTGAPTEAVATLESAAVDLERLGFPVDVLRAHYFVGLAHLRAGHRSAARRALTCSREAAGERGIVSWSGLADAALVRLDGATEGVLTATEQMIVAKVAGGLRNREIGGELFISESTVEAHLTRIYRKLGVRGRAELLTLEARGR